jgi:mannose-6-phosphate isomerase-like protein (cupin superfamily)
MVEAGGGRRGGAGPMTFRVIEDGEHTSGTHAVLEFTITGDFSPPPHIHHEHEEVIYVLEGVMALLVRDETVRLGPGAAFVTPIGLPHTFSNGGDGPLRFLLTISPASHLAYFDAVAEAMQAARGTPEPQTIMGIMQRFGLEPIRPA